MCFGVSEVDALADIVKVPWKTPELENLDMFSESFWL